MILKMIAEPAKTTTYGVGQKMMNVLSKNYDIYDFCELVLSSPISIIPLTRITKNK